MIELVARPGEWVWTITERAEVRYMYVDTVCLKENSTTYTLAYREDSPSSTNIVRNEKNVAQTKEELMEKLFEDED